MAINLYRVVRPIGVPMRLIIVARSRKGAQRFVTKRYGYSNSLVEKIPFKVGTIFIEARGWQ